MKTIFANIQKFQSVLFLTLTVLILSCNKSSELEIEQLKENGSTLSNQNFNRTNTSSNVNLSDVQAWLLAQKGHEDSSTNRNRYIDNIYNSLNISQIQIDEWSDEEFILSIPIDPSITRHKIDGRSKVCLVLFENNEGEIRNGEIAIITNSDGSPVEEYVKFRDLYLNDVKYGYSGKLALVTLQDFKFFEKVFVDGQLSQSESTYGRDFNPSENCINYYLLHIDYNLITGEIIDDYVIDLGCLSCAPNSLCDEIIPIGPGGIATQPGTTTTVHTVEMFGDHVPAGYNNWKVTARYTVRGWRNINNRALSIFSTVDYNNGSAEPQWIAGTQTIFSTSYYYFVIHSLTHSENVMPSTANCTMQCILRYPNQGNMTLPRAGYHIFEAIVI